MNHNEIFEIQADAFNKMTGFTALGKDNLFDVGTTRQRAKRWADWLLDNHQCIEAMLYAFDLHLALNATDEEILQEVLDSGRAPETISNEVKTIIHDAKAMRIAQLEAQVHELKQMIEKTLAMAPAPVFGYFRRK